MVLNLSYLPITSKCLSQILQLQHIEDLILEGCYGIDDDGLATIKVGCKSLQKLDVSSSQNVSHVGLSSLTNVAGFLQQLNLSYGSRVDLDLANSLGKLSMLQSIKLDGCQVTCSGLKAIANGCVSLQELNLSKCMGVTDEGLSSVVTKHKDMKKLDITCCRKITKMSLANVTKMYCVRFVPYEDDDLGKRKKEVMRPLAVVDVEGFSPSHCGGVWLPDGDDSLVGDKVCRRWQRWWRGRWRSAIEYNLFVRSLNKQATEKEVEELYRRHMALDCEHQSSCRRPMPVPITIFTEEMDQVTRVTVGADFRLAARGGGGWCTAPLAVVNGGRDATVNRG
ncbi:hypothetical protein CASFOL_000471 [Castilleja foliolosa]|uniref:F-box/LRR-repeat protein 15-like leucin rich repeat domain-containing protein n=1 Tax=Castilleja foliolosa TaxID=1961234 RepID=A0ABD3EPG9_9LAMI